MSPVDEQTWLDAWNSRTAGPIIEICAPEVEIHAVTLGIEGRHYKGHDGVREWMRDIRDRFRAYSVVDTITELDEGAVLVHGKLHWPDETTGEELDQRFTMLCHVRDGKALWIGTFFSPTDARAAWESGVTGPTGG